MLKIETLTELEHLTNFDTVYEVISMQALKYCPYYSNIYLELVDSFELTFPASNGRLIYDLLNELELFENPIFDNALNRRSLAANLADFYKDQD
jgi:hypothetical protein